MKAFSSKHSFTLLEVSIAALLLAISAVSALTVVGTARGDLLREQRRREREHHMANAVEFFLMAGPKAVLPAGLLPDGFDATCDVMAVEEGLPEQAYEEISGWLLGEYHIVVTDADGNLVGEQSVRKILKSEEDLDVVGLGAN